jgi:hypothetical protein
MDLLEFKKRFKIAACFCRDFSNKHIEDQLPENIRFEISKKEKQITAEDTLNSLFREGAIPVWIDFHVSSYNKKHTIIKATYSDDFTLNEKDFYHQREGLPPFHIIGPTAPVNWKSLEKDGPFAFSPCP